jgi:MFS superfamily sulfate permease-like transporter
MQQNLGQILSFFVPSLSNIFSFIMGFVTSLLASYMYAYLQRRTGSRYLRAFRRRTPLDRELVSQGVGNTLCGLLGGLPITAIIVHNSANISARGAYQGGGRLPRSAAAPGDPVPGRGA